MQVLLSPCRPAVRQANISFDGIEAEALLLYLDMKGVSVSAGAACSAGALEPSHVLTAMGISPELAKGTIRISLDRDEHTGGRRIPDGGHPGRGCAPAKHGIKIFERADSTKICPLFMVKTDENHFLSDFDFPFKKIGGIIKV